MEMDNVWVYGDNYQYAVLNCKACGRDINIIQKDTNGNPTLAELVESAKTHSCED